MTRVSDELLGALVDQITAGFGGKVEVVPRVFLRELVDILDRVDQHDAYDPAVHYRLTLDGGISLSAEEVAAKEGKPLADAAEESLSDPALRARRLDGMSGAGLHHRRCRDS